MRSLAKALTLYSREALNDLIGAWTTAFVPKANATKAKNQKLLHLYLIQRLEELIR